jgi:hypothetical protein
LNGKYSRGVAELKKVKRILSVCIDIVMVLYILVLAAYIASTIYSRFADLPAPGLGDLVFCTGEGAVYGSAPGSMTVVRLREGAGAIAPGIAGEPLVNIPYVGYVLSFSGTPAGAVICIIIPSIIIIIYSLSALVDSMHDSSRHRRRILRRRSRRRERYLKEGLIRKNRRAA